MKNLLIIFTFVFIIQPNAWAKKCTESDIRNALSSKKKFDFDAEGCTDDVVYVSKGINLSGSMTVDGKNKLRLSWKGTGSKCDEIPRGDEYATFYTSGSNNVMKNFTILLSPEGIHLSKGNNNLVDNVKFDRICEDAITNGNKSTSSATGSVIKNSQFLNAPDKAIQCNGGSVTVENSTFKNIPRSIAGCTYKADPGNHTAKECPVVCHIKAYNNKLYGCSGGYGMRGAGYLQKKKQGTLTAIGNYFENCKTPLMASQYGYVYGENNTVKGSCDQFANTEQNGTGEICNNNISACKKEYKGSVAKKCKTQGSSTLVSETDSENETNAGTNLTNYSAEGSGGTSQQNLSTSEKEKLACSRAEDRAILSARGQCNGKVVSQKTDQCEDRCSHSSGSTTCKATATVTCEG